MLHIAWNGDKIVNKMMGEKIYDKKMYNDEITWSREWERERSEIDRFN